MPLSVATLARRFQRLDRDARTAFVAGLYTARGNAVERDGSVLVADRPGGLLRVAVGPPSDGEEVDAVVVAGDRERRRVGPTDARVLGPAALHDRLCYGVDRAAAARLCRVHFDVGFDASDARGPRRSRVVAGVAVVLVALAAVAVLVLSTPVSPIAGPDKAAVGPDKAAVGPDGAATTNVTSADLRAPETLARSHRAALRARPSVRLNVTFAGPRHVIGFDGRRSGYDVDDVVSVSMRVGADGSYRSVRQTSFAGGPLIQEQATVARYADGDTEYVLVDDKSSLQYERRSVTRSGRSFAVDLSRWVLPSYLTTNRTRVERLPANASARYRVVATGQPRALNHEVRGYRATAHVAADGLVTQLSVAYVHAGTGAAVSVDARFDSPADVGPPAWYETAREQTRENV